MSSNSTQSVKVQSVNYSVLTELLQDVPDKHWQEVPFGTYQMELDLCHDVYTYSEQIGYARFYVVFVDEVFAGYMSVMASEMIHHRGMVQANTDSFYIVPEFRNSGAFTALLTYVEADLNREGVRFFTVGLNPNMPHFENTQAFLERDGFQVTEISMTKELS